EILLQHVRWIERGRPAVLALGGGAFTEPGNRELLSEHGISVWLDCPFEMVERRVAQNPGGVAVRPLARDPEKFAALYEARRDVYVIGAGKAGASMAKAAERVLGRRIAAGLVNVKDGHVARLRRIELNECGHPVPDARGVAGAERIAAIAAAAGKDDLVLCLIS